MPSTSPSPDARSASNACPRCGAPVGAGIKTRFNTLDLLGVAALGTFVLLVLSPFLFSSAAGARYAYWIAAAALFGLYHMVGRRKSRVLHCQQCGFEQRDRLSATTDPH